MLKHYPCPHAALNTEARAATPLKPLPLDTSVCGALIVRIQRVRVFYISRKLMDDLPQHPHQHSSFLRDGHYTALQLPPLPVKFNVSN